MLFGRIKPDFEDMYRQQYDRIYHYAYTLLLNKQNAEDVVQETFLAAYRTYGSYDPNRASLSTWLFRIAHNKAVDLMRSAPYRLHADWPETLDFGEEDPGCGRLLEEQETVLFLFSRLSPAERELLNMRYTLELKDKEVASVLGISEKAANKRFQRLLKNVWNCCLQTTNPTVYNNRSAEERKTR